MMTDKEMKSLTKQMCHTHGSNKRAEKCLKVYMTALPEEKTYYFARLDGFQNWDVILDPRSYLDVFPKEQLVYLTSESENEITELDLSKVYIIGGIVDHNRLKGITFNKAMGQGIATARLPIDQLCNMKERKVLAVNHVFDILLKVIETDGNWEAAMEAVIPSRKFTTYTKKERNEQVDEETDDTSNVM